VSRPRTPLPRWAYISAVITPTVVVYALAGVALVLLGRTFDSLPDRWLSLVSRCGPAHWPSPRRASV
jgi:hypothetical protein